MKTSRSFKSAKEFGTFLGLSEIEMMLIEQKKKIIEQIKISRIKNNLTQASLALLLNTSQPAIARMESGLVSDVSLDFLAKAAMILNIKLVVKAS
jgi:hypothetical protein